MNLGSPIVKRLKPMGFKKERSDVKASLAKPFEKHGLTVFFCLQLSVCLINYLSRSRLMNMKRSGWRLRCKKVPFQTLAEFCDAILRSDKIDLVCFSDHLSEQGFVSVYLRNAATSEDYGGGALILEAFNELCQWIQKAPQLKGRNIALSGKLKQKAS